MPQTAVSIIRRLHQHRAWVNENLLAASSSLSEEQLHRPFEIGQGTVWKSFVHLQAAEYVWLEALLGIEEPVFPGDARGKLPGNQLGEGGVTNFSELRDQWRTLEQRWTEYLNTLTPDSLDDPVYKVSASDNAGQRFVCHRSDGLLHVCTHAQYTTAQILNMLRHLGVAKLPKPMLISLAWQEGTIPVP